MLEAVGLECERGARRLFSGLSFALAGGELLRVAGANGSGKTTLLKILCGLLAPDAGEVRWRGQPVGALREEYARELVFLGHAAAVKDELTAAENLSFACAVSGLRAPKEKIESSLAGFKIPAVPLKQLSQGQRRRAALARLVLAGKVPLWLLDEPFTALDAAAADLVEGLIRGHAAAGGAVAFTTHQDARLGDARVIALDA